MCKSEAVFILLPAPINITYEWSFDFSEKEKKLLALNIIIQYVGVLNMTFILL